MNINLTPGQERIPKDELKSDYFNSVEELIGEALQALREREKPSASNGTQQDAVREMLAFVQNNHVCLQGVTVKELIREGHRL